MDWDKVKEYVESLGLAYDVANDLLDVIFEYGQTKAEEATENE